MSYQDDGGWAFACVTERHLQEGMTLRDYFAGQVLSYLASEVLPDHASKQAYEYADAMIEARKK